MPTRLKNARISEQESILDLLPTEMSSLPGLLLMIFYSYFIIGYSYEVKYLSGLAPENDYFFLLVQQSPQKIYEQ